VSGPFTGSVAIETLTRLMPGTDGGTSRTSLEGRFQPSSQWLQAECIIDAGVCCSSSVGLPNRGLSAGIITVSFPLADGGVEQTSVDFDPDAGAYDSDISIPLSNGFGWVSDLSASGEVVPAFDIPDEHLQGPAPVLMPDLSELMSLSTGQDWTVPLVPSPLEYGFIDTLIIEGADGTIISCQTNDEGSLIPPLVVAESLLAPLQGQKGTIYIYRDDYRGGLDAGGVNIDYRVGIGVMTGFNAISFTP
jgi:hypothetical protein